MNCWHFYNLDTGLFNGASFVGQTKNLANNTPSECGAAAGVIDWTSQKVDLQTGAVVDYQPPAPADDQLRTWTWDGQARRWLATPTAAALALDARRERDQRLADCDWVTLRAIDLGQPPPAAWAAYRAALRAVPEQPGFPTSIDWPTAPA